MLLIADNVGQENYLAHDHLYSPVALLSSAGGIMERYEYDAYGRRSVFAGDFTARSNSSFNNCIAFTGQRLDNLGGGDLQLMYYKNRYYDPESGRFLSHDPLGFVDGLNLYEYVGSRPTVKIDPYGFSSLECDRELEKARREHRNRGDRYRENSRKERREERRENSHLNSDWAGRALLKRYLTGGGDWHIKDEQWGMYMRANELLKPQVSSPLVLEFYEMCRNGEKERFIDIAFNAEIENGEGIIGYHYLHGTNADVGGFQIRGKAVLEGRWPCCKIKFRGTYTWNDIIDPNPQYSTDTWKSRFAEAITLGKAQGYIVRIEWQADSTYEINCTSKGRKIDSSGWPFK